MAGITKRAAEMQASAQNAEDLQEPAISSTSARPPNQPGKKRGVDGDADDSGRACATPIPASPRGKKREAGEETDDYERAILEAQTTESKIVTRKTTVQMSLRERRTELRTCQFSSSIQAPWNEQL